MLFDLFTFPRHRRTGRALPRDLHLSRRPHPGTNPTNSSKFPFFRVLFHRGEGGPGGANGPRNPTECGAAGKKFRSVLDKPGRKKLPGAFLPFLIPRRRIDLNPFGVPSAGGGETSTFAFPGPRGATRGGGGKGVKPRGFTGRSGRGSLESPLAAAKSWFNASPRGSGPSLRAGKYRPGRVCFF